MKTLITALLASVFVTATAHADQFKTVKVESNENNYELYMSYPEFFPNSVPGYEAINQDLVGYLVESGCELDGGQKEIGYYYEVSVRVIALNKRYVGLEVGGGSYCGGAHPNYGTYYLTYDSQTGNQLEISKEFGFDPISYEWKEGVQLKLAQLLVKNIPADDECFADMSKQEKVEQMLSFWPTVGGLAKDKTVVLTINPPHVATVCGFSIRLKYNEVEDLIVPGSYLHQWLR